MRVFGTFFMLFCSLVFCSGCYGNDPDEVSKGKDLDVMEKSLADVIGATHVRGNYYLTEKDYLNEGADAILEMGSRVTKVWFYSDRHEHPQDIYLFNSDWREVDSLVEGAKQPYYKKLFSKPFSTYMLVVTALGRPGGYWYDGITQQQALDEKQQFYELTKYLLETYQGTGKTFILQHWEGDWMTRRHTDRKADVDPQIHKNMIRWLNARQAGVNKAREECGVNGVNVYHATEVNNVLRSVEHGQANIVNAVLPYTNVDLVTYSAYDSIFLAIDGRDEAFGRCVQYIKDHLPPSAVFGDDSVFIGEYGVPENEFTSVQLQTVVKNTVETSLEMNCPWIVYWQLYCNELKNPSKSGSYNVKEADGNYSHLIDSNDDARGFWLIRQDGSKTWVYNYLSDLCEDDK